MSNPKWCTKHSQYAHDCSECAVLSALAPMAERSARVSPETEVQGGEETPPQSREDDLWGLWSNSSVQAQRAP